MESDCVACAGVDGTGGMVFDVAGGGGGDVDDSSEGSCKLEGGGDAPVAGLCDNNDEFSPDRGSSRWEGVGVGVASTVLEISVVREPSSPPSADVDVTASSAEVVLSRGQCRLAKTWP